MDPEQLARHIDHALLHPALSDQEFAEGCSLGRELGVAAVCVKSVDVPRAVERLAGSEVAVAAVAGFPHGNMPVEILCREVEWALDHGAEEIDAVIDLSRAVSGDWRAVKERIEAVNRTVTRANGRCKIILEMGLYANNAIKRRLCRLCRELEVAYVKTSTGFATTRDSDGSLCTLGATEQDVALMVQEVAPVCGVKASGGIRSLAQAERLLGLGATRIGTTATRSIVEEARERKVDASATQTRPRANGSIESS